MSDARFLLTPLIGICIGLGIVPEAAKREDKLVSTVQKNTALKAQTKIEPVCMGDTNDANWLYPVNAHWWKYFEGGMLPYRVTCG